MKENLPNLPNLIIIGAQKAGTTSLYNWLAQHPEIYGHEALKDFNFFLDNFYYEKLGFSWLSKQYKGGERHKIRMHGFVNYMYFYDISLQRLKEYKKQYVPDLKLIAVLRNPVKRAYSAFWDAKKVYMEDSNTFREAIIKEKTYLKRGTFTEKVFRTYIDHGFYYKQLKPFVDNFEDSIKIVIFEELVSNPEAEITEIYNWLSVDPNFIPEFYIKNKAGVPKSKLLQKTIQKIELPYILKKLLPLNIRHLKLKILREWNIKPVKYPPLEEELKQELVNVYKEDIKKLENLLGKDLSIWLK